jgi:ribonuclease HI
MSIIFFDGGCKTNSESIKVGVVILHNTGKIEFYKYTHIGYGKNTSNDAEWLACHLAVDLAIELKIKNVNLYGDSRVVINRASRDYDKEKQRRGAVPNMTRFVDLFRIKKSKFNQITIEWVPRNENLAGIFLEFGEKRVRELMR